MGWLYSTVHETTGLTVVILQTTESLNFDHNQ